MDRWCLFRIDIEKPFLVKCFKKLELAMQFAARSRQQSITTTPDMQFKIIDPSGNIHAISEKATGWKTIWIYPKTISCEPEIEIHVIPERNDKECL